MPNAVRPAAEADVQASRSELRSQPRAVTEESQRRFPAANNINTMTLSAKAPQSGFRSETLPCYWFTLKSFSSAVNHRLGKQIDRPRSKPGMTNIPAGMLSIPSSMLFILSGMYGRQGGIVSRRMTSFRISCVLVVAYLLSPTYPPYRALRIILDPAALKPVSKPVPLGRCCPAERVRDECNAVAAGARWYDR